MKTKWFLAVLAPVAMLCLTSCPETSVPRDFGSKSLKLKTADWVGTWREAGETEAFRFEIRDAEKGQLTAITFNKEKKTEEKIEFIVRTTGFSPDDRLCFLTSFEKPDSPKGSLSLITRPTKGVMYLWGLNHDAVEAAIKSGELKGSLEEMKEKDDKGKDKSHNHSLLKSDRGNYEKLLQPKYWEWSNPSAFVRGEADKGR